MNARYRINSCSAGWISGYRQRWFRFIVVLLAFSLLYLHVPIIGIMFFCALLGGGALHLLLTSLAMDTPDVWEFMQLNEIMFAWLAIYPAFASLYVKKIDMTVFMGVCQAMWALGLFMGHTRWPSQLHCGDF